MSIFDPLGLISHFLMYLKVLLQDVWRSGIHWDEAIEDTLFEKWCRWLKVLPQVENVEIPRWFKSADFPDSCTIQLHTFVDASETGMAAAVFLRFSHKNIIRWCSGKNESGSLEIPLYSKARAPSSADWNQISPNCSGILVIPSQWTILLDRFSRRP